MKKFYLLLLLISSFAIKSQNFRITAVNIPNVNTDSCSTAQIDILTYLGCRNYVHNTTTVNTVNDTLHINIDYSAGPICLGALSQPVFNQQITGLSPNVFTYTVVANASINGTPTNSIVSSSNLFVSSCATTFVEERTLNTNFELFPNPTQKSFIINLPKTSHSSIEISILNMNGKVIRKQEVSTKRKILTYDVSQYKSGIYFIQIKNNSSVTTKKLVIN